MPDPKAYQHHPWRDRFNRPTKRELRKALPEEAAETFDCIRKHMQSVDGVEETMAWYGHSWYWTIAFRTRLSDDPLAVVIPSPEDLQIAVPLAPDFAESLQLKGMKRALRDGLDLAREPFNTRWAIWSLMTPRLLEDVMDLIDLKLRHLAKKAG